MSKTGVGWGVGSKVTFGQCLKVSGFFSFGCLLLAKEGHGKGTTKVLTILGSIYFSVKATFVMMDEEYDQMCWINIKTW